jgi:alcohol dehydrogenase (cytochrome c)
VAPDARVLAFEFKTGKQLWATRIGDPKRGESVPGAPIAWDGIVYIGNAGGDFKGGKGHMYALEGNVWEFYLTPKTEGDTPRGPVGTTPLVGSTWNNAPGIPVTGAGTWTSYTKKRAAVRTGRQSGSRLRFRSAGGKQSLYRLGRRTRCQDGEL